MLWMLEQNPRLQRVALCLDNDEPGVKATARLVEVLQEKGYSPMMVLVRSAKSFLPKKESGSCRSFSASRMRQAPDSR